MKNRIGIVLLLSMMSGVAELRVADVFTDHMVLQRDKPVAVWGSADAGATVTVEFAGQKKTVVADSSNHWKISLDPMPASSESRTLQVSSFKFQVSFSDVLVGEVWLCSGQSNMAFPVSRGLNAEKEMQSADFPEIRLLMVDEELSGTPQNHCRFRGKTWRPCAPDTVKGFSAVGYFFGRKLHQDLDIPIGLIKAAWGGTRIEAWTDWDVTAGDPVAGYVLPEWSALIDQVPDYKTNFDAYRQFVKSTQSENFKIKHTPAAIYNAMIVPLAPYTMRGVIWYQGEANSPKPLAYRSQLPLMIKNWRSIWNDPEMAFYIVQLANLGPEQQKPLDVGRFTELRDAQLYTVRTVPNTALATAVDIGDADDIHPKNKQEVGRRLALPALNRIYGKPCEDSGPVFESLKQDGNSLLLTFSHADGLQSRDGDPLKGFAIRSDDGKWVWADAQVVGDQIKLSAQGVAVPAAARYSWAGNPIGNLVNGAGLPALPFRTDDELSEKELMDQKMIKKFQQSKEN